MKALEGWSQISDNLFVWDYGINFDNYLSPFPNFHILQDNIRTFRDHHVKMHFSQIAGSWCGDFAELRAYLVAKLMWNPDADVDSLMTTFLRGYYGPAAPQIEKCLRLQQGALLGSRTPLWLYDSPVTHKDGMLSPYMLRTYGEIFDKAESLVADNPLLLARVRRARLPIQYSELEIQRVNPDKDVADIERKLTLFKRRAREGGLTMLNERHNSPDEYVDLYRSRYLTRATDNLAYGAKVTFSEEPPAPYCNFSATALTDGIHGGATFKDSWVGWEDKDVSLTVDLGENRQVSTFDTDFLQQLGAWVLQPKSVAYYTSVDGKNFSHAGTVKFAEDKTPQVKFISARHESASPIEARYVRIDIEGTKKCPEWHYGVGNPCWFMLDEILIK